MEVCSTQGHKQSDLRLFLTQPNPTQQFLWKQTNLHHHTHASLSGILHHSCYILNSKTLVVRVRTALGQERKARAVEGEGLLVHNMPLHKQVKLKG
jgi:hypothetical protein